MAGKAKAPKGKTSPKKAAQKKRGKGTQQEKQIITCSEPVQQESKFAIDKKQIVQMFPIVKVCIVYE